MDLNNLIVTLSQEAEVSEPALFPFPFSFHVAFVCIGVVFFVFRFLKLKKPYQIILAAAMFCSLGIPLSEGKKGLFYLIGALEAVLLIAALITSIVCQKPEEQAAKPAGGEAQPANDAASDDEGSVAEDNDDGEEQGE